MQSADFDDDTEQAHDRRVQLRPYARPRESTLGAGCCQMCGRPRGMVRKMDGTERRGCRCGEVRGE